MIFFLTFLGIWVKHLLHTFDELQCTFIGFYCCTLLLIQELGIGIGIVSKLRQKCPALLFMATIKWARAVVPRGIRTSAICISQSSHAPVLLTEPQVLLGLLLLFLWLTNEIKSDFSSTYNPLKYWNILPTELKIFQLSGFDWFRECNKTQSLSSSRAKPASNIS